MMMPYEHIAEYIFLPARMHVFTPCVHLITPYMHVFTS